MLRSVFVLISITTFFLQQSYAQTCSTVPVRDVVRNGDFEAGYLQGAPGGNHVSTSGGPFDFYCDMGFLGEPPVFPGASCFYGISDKYAVMKRESYTCAGTFFENYTYWAVSYGGDANFMDHTLGLNGGGHALVVDLNSISVSPKTGGKPIAWEQTVDLIPSQNYQFSMWFANFSNGTAADLQVTITPFLESSGLPDVVDTISTGLKPWGLMVWYQLVTPWVPKDVYDKAIIRVEFVDPQGGSSGLDIALDDISFINSCQNQPGATVYIPDFELADTVSLDDHEGAIVLNAHVPSGQLNNATVFWYEGEGNPQTLISGADADSLEITTPGTYRVCIDDPDNNCSVNTNIVVTEEVVASLKEDRAVDFQLYPNPVSNEITWDSDFEYEKVFIYNSKGEAVKEVINPDANFLNVTDLEKGLFYIQLETGNNEIRSSSFIKN